MKPRRNRNESLCTLNGTSFTGPARLAVSTHGSIAGVVVVSAAKAQLQASWLMSQAGLASQTQDWNPLEMLTLVQVPLELELVLGTGDSCSSEVGPRECAGLHASACGPVGLSGTRLGWATVTCVLFSSGAGMR